MASYETDMFNPRNPKMRDVRHYTTDELHRFREGALDAQNQEDQDAIEDELTLRYQWRRSKQGRRSCYSCNFMDPGDGGRPGYPHGWTCRKRASDNFSGWRYVTKEDWCGDWESDNNDSRPKLDWDFSSKP